MSDYIVKAENICKSFGGVHALKGVSLSIKKGEIHCLAGENGCGKSTLIKVISGFYTADSGTLEIDGTTYDKITPAQAIGAGIQVIYQDFSVFPNLTVMENLALNDEVSNHRKIVSWKRFRETAVKALATIEIQMDLDELVENLAVADKQLIAICRALLTGAKLIIMDEPTTALTKKEVGALFEIIRKLQSQGIAVLFVSHKLDEVFEISERFTIFRSGQNVFSGETSELNNENFTHYMTGRNFDADNRVSPLDDKAPVVLETENLTLQNAFYNVSFSVKKGEILGITGLLGSGRTELVQTLFGYRRATSGSVKLEGAPVQIDSVKAAIRHGIGYVPEDRLTEGLFLRQSINRNILVSKWEDLSRRGVLDRKALAEQCERWIKELSVATKFPELPVQTLSGGNQQKVVLARWLATDLKVLILNGPTVGVDIGAKHDIHAIVRQLAAKGLAVIVISDDLPEILSNCHRVLIMQEGRFVGEADTATISQEELSALATTA